MNEVSEAKGLSQRTLGKVAAVAEAFLGRSAAHSDPSASLELRIRAHMKQSSVSVILTDNRHTMLSVRKIAKKHYQIRAHHMFATAPAYVTQALAQYVEENCRTASTTLGRYIDEHDHLVRPRPKRSFPIKLQPVGQFHDLQNIFDTLNAKYFNGRINARITWGPRTKGRRRQSMRMGSYSLEEQLIRIHRSLDRAMVPRYFVEWVVYHEMLHQVHGVQIVNGRRCYHSPEFEQDEALFEEYEPARIWERENIDYLLNF